MTESFDLRDVLSGRRYPAAVVKVWFNEEPFFRLARLWEKHSTTTDKEEEKRLSEEIDKAEKDRDSQAYKIEIRAISNRHKEDIHSKSLVEYPIKRDAFGFEDTTQTNLRVKDLQERVLRAYIQKIISPEGREQVVNEDDQGLAVVRTLMAEAPESTLDMINNAITAIQGKAEMSKYAEMDLDFLSGN